VRGRISARPPAWRSGTRAMARPYVEMIRHDKECVELDSGESDAPKEGGRGRPPLRNFGVRGRADEDVRPYEISGFGEGGRGRPPLRDG
jgi:hypothetical protein